MGVAGSCDESWAIMALAVGRRFVSLTAIGQSASSQGVKPGGTDQEGLTPVFPYRYFPPPSSQMVGEERQKKVGVVGGDGGRCMNMNRQVKKWLVDRETRIPVCVTTVKELME